MDASGDDTIPPDLIRDRLTRPVVIVGMMGAGKTRLGRMLADLLKLRFYDSDEEIEKAAGLSVAEIFDRFGEPYFRDGEHRVIQRLLDSGVAVIATGGGAIMDSRTAEALKKQAVTIWLKTDLSLMVERTGRNDRRPLLRQGNPEEILRNLMEKRDPLYRAAADITIESDKSSAGTVLERALKQLHAFLGADKLAP